MASKADTGGTDAKPGIKRRPAAAKKATAVGRRVSAVAASASEEVHDAGASHPGPELEQAHQRGSRFAAVPSASVMREAVTTRTALRVRRRDVTAFLRQLIMMIEAGTPILKALKTLSTRGGRAGIRGMVAGMTEYVESGNPLWQAFAREDRNFSSVDVSLIKASEASGTLTTVLTRIVSYREQHERMERRVRGAMIYPSVVGFACFAAVVLIAKFVIPEFEGIFKTFDIEITGYSKTMIGIYKFVADWWWLMIIVVAVLYAVNRAFLMSSPLHRIRMDRLMLRLPVVGSLQQRWAIADFMRTFSLMMKSGLSMMSTLDLCRDSIRNRAYSDAIQEMRDSVERGEGLEQPLRTAERKGLLPPVVTDMLLTGEDTGTLDTISSHIADTYEEEVTMAVATIGEAVQPIITIFMGAVVLTLAVGLFGPLVQMIEKISAAGV